MTFLDAVLKRIVVTKAVNVAWVLDQFERSGWPQSVPVPPEWRGGATLNDTLKSLNAGLERMRFHAHSGEAVTWEITG